MLIYKKEVTSTLLLISLIGVSQFLLLPYVQLSANQHMNSGPCIGAIYLFLAVTLLVYSLVCFIKKCKINYLVFLLAFSLTCSYYGWTFFGIFCTKCAALG